MRRPARKLSVPRRQGQPPPRPQDWPLAAKPFAVRPQIPKPTPLLLLTGAGSSKAELPPDSDRPPRLFLFPLPSRCASQKVSSALGTPGLANILCTAPVLAEPSPTTLAFRPGLSADSNCKTRPFCGWGGPAEARGPRLPLSLAGLGHTIRAHGHSARGRHGFPKH